MFDKNQPYNDLPSLPPQFNKDDADILKKSYKAAVAVASLSAQTSTAFNNFSNSFLLMESFFLPEAVSSSEVENIVTTVEEAFDANILPEAERSGPKKETIHYKDALFKGMDLLKKRGFLSTNEYSAIQAILEPNKKGIRSVPGYSLQNQSTGEVFYTPPEGTELIRAMLKNFDDYLNEAPDDPDAMIRMAILHYQFEAIHPFRDGNGRTGRILMPLYLQRHGCLVYPVLFISSYILKNRSAYYKLLRRVTSKQEWKPWILFILDAVETQANSTYEVLAKVVTLSEQYERKLGTSGIPPTRHHAIVDFIFTTPTFTRDAFARGVGVHANTADSYLQRLRKKDLIQFRKSGKRLHYYNAKFITTLKQN